MDYVMDYLIREKYKVGNCFCLLFTVQVYYRSHDILNIC